jgi:hypothetical protein
MAANKTYQIEGNASTPNEALEQLANNRNALCTKLAKVDSTPLEAPGLEYLVSLTFSGQVEDDEVVIPSILARSKKGFSEAEKRALSRADGKQYAIAYKVTETYQLTPPQLEAVQKRRTPTAGPEELSTVYCRSHTNLFRW